MSTLLCLRSVGRLAALTGVVGLGACSLVLGIDPPTLDESRADGAIGSSEGGPVDDSGGRGDGATTSADGAPLDGALLDGAADAPIDAHCDFDGGTPGDGIFVAPSPYGSAQANCGAISGPCSTIQLGIERAHQIGKTMVFVARPDQDHPYVESLSFPAGYGGITVEGAWETYGQTWSRSCTLPLHDVVVVQAPSTATRSVSAVDVGGEVTLRYLTFRSKAAASAGESLYGVFATGSSTSMVLDDVVVSVAGGGDGTEGAPGTGGAQAANGCPAGDGAPATADGTGGPGALAGTFTVAGYVSSSATAGGTGNAGHNGSVNAVPACASCVSCSGVAVCSTKANGTSCGTAAKAGCGGPGGGGGSPGNSGGASVGVFAWNAHVTIARGTVHSSAGGAGGMGGPGGGGGQGGNGQAGDAGADCVGSCNAISCSNGALIHGDPGTPALAGGAGSAGGVGGAGAGGPSFAVVQGGGAAMVTLGTGSTAPTLEHGDGGASAGDGAAGASGARFP